MIERFKELSLIITTPAFASACLSKYQIMTLAYYAIFMHFSLFTELIKHYMTATAFVFLNVFHIVLLTISPQFDLTLR